MLVYEVEDAAFRINAKLFNLPFATPRDSFINYFSNSDIEQKAQDPHYENGNPNNFILHIFPRNIFNESNASCSRQKLCCN